MGAGFVRQTGEVRFNISKLIEETLIVNFHRFEVDRNRQKVMEINYLLDTKQSQFDALTTKLGTGGKEVGEDGHVIIDLPSLK
jgi:hypothetical protein